MRIGQLLRPGSLRVAVTGAVLALGLTVQACTPASASSIGNRFFGMHAPSLLTAFPKAKVGAVNLTTNGVYWPSIETSSGTFDFTRVDALVAAARANGAKPLLVLGQTPKFHSTRPNAANVAATVPYMKPWRAYVRKVVNRYGAKLDYEIWPEPNITSNWAGTPKQLAQLTGAAANIIHRVARQAVVVGPAMVLRLKFERKFMAAFYGSKVGGKGIGGYLDAVGVDPYPLAKGTPEGSLALIKKAKETLRAHRVRKPLWNVETNYGVQGGGSTTRVRFSARKQASYVVRTHLLNAAAGVKRVYWLGWGRYSTMAIQMVGADGTTPTTAGRAYSVVRSWMLHQHVKGCSFHRSKHLYVCKMVKSGRASWVYWTTRGKTVVRAPKGSRKVVTMLGKTSGTRAGRRLTVTSAPIWVHH